MRRWGESNAIYCHWRGERTLLETPPRELGRSWLRRGGASWGRAGAPGVFQSVPLRAGLGVSPLLFQFRESLDRWWVAVKTQGRCGGQHSQSEKTLLRCNVNKKETANPPNVLTSSRAGSSARPPFRKGKRPALPFPSQTRYPA